MPSVLSYSKSFLFVHVPKTGGQSIYSALQPHVSQTFLSNDYHSQFTTASRLRDMVGHAAWERYFRFAFVRNPWDKAVSVYHYISRASRCGYWSNAGSHLPESMSFENFIRDFRAVNPETEFHHAYTQSSIICDEKGNPLVDFVGRFENLQQGFDQICDRIGIEKVVLPVRNKTYHRHYRTYYTPGLRELIRLQFKEDVERFGYEF